MVGIEYIVDLGYLGNEIYSIKDYADSSPTRLAQRIVSDLRERFPELVMYRDGFEVNEFDIEMMTKGETILAWKNEEASENDDGSHTCASICCVRDLDDWIEEHIGSPSHAWDRWVGNQTPQEFMDCSPDQSIDEAVAEYVDELLNDKLSLAYYGWLADYPDVREALIKALVNEIEGSGAIPTYLKEED